VLPVLRFGHQVQAGEPAGQSLERRLGFEASEGGTQAEVDAVAEGEVSAVIPGEVEAIGICEPGRIPVGRGQQGQDLLTLLDRDPPELDVAGGRPGRGVHRSVVAQQLLDGRRHEGRVLHEAV